MAPIQVGALLYDWQVLDVAGPFDLLSSVSKPILEYANSHITTIGQHLVDKAREFEFHHIGETMEPITLLTSNFKVLPTVLVDDCPELDILVIGGTIPETHKFSEKFADFIRHHAKANKLIFTTCTGASHLASTGVLDGRNATVNNVEYGWIVKNFPKVNWSKDKKWVIDGNIWTGSGASSAMDMIAHYIKERWGLDMMIAAAKNLDFEPRDIDGMYYTVFPKRYDAQGKQVSTNDLS